jgi:hypothetical protein
VRVQPRRRRLDARLVVIPLAVAIGLFSWRLASGGGGGGKQQAAPVPPTRTRVRATTATRTTPRPPRLAHVVLVAARGPCWLEVRSGGERIYEHELEQGERTLFTGTRLWIRIGAPWNLDATVNGKRIALPATTGNIVVTPR